MDNPSSVYNAGNTQVVCTPAALTAQLSSLFPAVGCSFSFILNVQAAVRLATCSLNIANGVITIVGTGNNFANGDAVWIGAVAVANTQTYLGSWKK